MENCIIEEKTSLNEEWCFVIEETEEYEKALRLFDRGEYDLALEILEKEVDNASDNIMKSFIYDRIGLCYVNRPKLYALERFDYMEGIQYFLQAIDEYGDDLTYHFHVASAYNKIGNLSQVIKHCQIVLNHKDDPKAVNDLIRNAEELLCATQQDLKDNCVIL